MVHRQLLELILCYWSELLTILDLKRELLHFFQLIFFDSLNLRYFNNLFRRHYNTFSLELLLLFVLAALGVWGLRSSMFYH